MTGVCCVTRAHPDRVADTRAVRLAQHSTCPTRQKMERPTNQTHMHSKHAPPPSPLAPRPRSPCVPAKNLLLRPGQNRATRGQHLLGHRQRWVQTRGADAYGNGANYEQRQVRDEKVEEHHGRHQPQEGKTHNENPITRGVKTPVAATTAHNHGRNGRFHHGMHAGSV